MCSYDEVTSNLHSKIVLVWGMCAWCGKFLQAYKNPRLVDYLTFDQLPPPFFFIFFDQERTKNAQFIIISLRNNMFELADRLVGIYKTDNTTKSVTIDPYKMAQAVLQQQAQPTVAWGGVAK